MDRASARPGHHRFDQATVTTSHRRREGRRASRRGTPIRAEKVNPTRSKLSAVDVRQGHWWFVTIAR